MQAKTVTDCLCRVDQGDVSKGYLCYRPNFYRNAFLRTFYCPAPIFETKSEKLEFPPPCNYSNHVYSDRQSKKSFQNVGKIKASLLTFRSGNTLEKLKESYYIFYIYI